MNNRPPFQITNKILELSQDISYELGILAGSKLYSQPIKLRKNNQIKTIHSSLAIEGNSLSVEQITDIINGKRVLAPEKDILEVNNAIKLYNDLTIFDPFSVESLLKAHEILMQGLVEDNGKWRKGNAAIFKGTEIIHFAPPASRVSLLMQDLFEFIAQDKNVSGIVKACIFHYEFEFIHPFSDGNGRIGRLWQQLLLMQVNKIFEYLSVESLIKNNQSEYYSVLHKCDKLGESTLFIGFMLDKIVTALRLYSNNITYEASTPLSRMEFAKVNLIDKWFSRKDYINVHKNISTATASRDLLYGLEHKLLISKGDKNQSCYKFV
ncbi:Fic family protein [Rickettsia helvetica]|uniref:Cell filamentation protein Fic n=1 Tax=Rickettsia helvetica TaxID=35789 RepID=A0ABM9NCI7_RICHE|nr:Fic family protein [Rickettsia helvetica]MCZ6884542.1 Fic family protein [Rickettsia endosymbiont of Ixodes ricinus]MCZ6896895.1 Fic family protein [Rickettsia endosymbiont of Ixodes ricinus]